MSPAAFSPADQSSNLKSYNSAIEITGDTLTIDDVVNVARNNALSRLSTQSHVITRIQDSVDFLQTKLKSSIYGVTTGFGGSADTRTKDLKALQLALLEHQLAGILPSDTSFDRRMPLTDANANVMPEAIVRGAILIRINSLARGHSGVRVEVLEQLNKLLELNITPCVPLRGTISASGDLSPLSYVASTITGHSDVRVVDNSSGTPKIIPAPAALKLHGLEPITLGPKEGLGLINGTAFSTSAAALVLHEANLLATLSQALTALTVEAMVGTVDSFDPFIHDVTRPHEGQVKCAANIRKLLANSKLAQFEEEEVAIEQDRGTLRQDRYPLRTAAQWIGPNLEALGLSLKQVAVELNSTTDNPLLDSKKQTVHHGGNFQACSPAKAMETTRLALQQFGKLSFSQLTEMLNCTMNRGLPSCLAGGNPSTNYHCKGIDIHAAAYAAELGFLANPVTSHVQSAEMHNQAVNSMAFVSARKTLEACNVLSMLFAAHLYAACQAIDLRAIEIKFKNLSYGVIEQCLKETDLLGDTESTSLARKLTNELHRRLEQTSSMDPQERFQDGVDFVTAQFVQYLSESGKEADNILARIQLWKTNTSSRLETTYQTTRDDYFANSDSSSELLGDGTAKLYSFVRDTLDVRARLGDVAVGAPQETIGSNVSRIYDSIVSGRIAQAFA